MLLRRLVEYAGRLPEAPTLYVETPVRYLIELDGQGRLRNLRPTDTADPASPRTKRGQPHRVPRVQRTSAVKPLLLCDGADYTLGVAAEGKDPQRAAACHQSYRDLLDRCLAETQEPAVRAVRDFLANEPLGQLDLPEAFAGDALVTFLVDDQFVVDLPAVRAFWGRYNDPAGAETPRVMQCVVCGRERPVLARLQGKIKGIPGGQTSGTAIISANAEAFESYGLKASLVAPTCAACGEAFTRALNALLADRACSYVLGGAAFVFWTRSGRPTPFASLLREPQPEEVRALLASLKRGGPAPAVDADAFYAAALSASGGRAVVRDWLDTTLAEAKRHCALWFQRQAIAGAWGEEPKPFGLYALAGATVRDPAKDLAPPTVRALVHAALAGAPLPIDLLYEAVRRSRAEQGVTQPRAALIKLVLRSRQPGNEEDKMVELDLSNSSPAYRCGRLLAELEAAQTAAIPGAKATIVSRFYGTASSAPASVFGHLLTGAQAHLTKLERDNPGAHGRLQRNLEEIQAGLSRFPRVLTLEEQGLFALGYYHQRAHDRAQAKAGAERRRAAQAADSDENPAEAKED